VLDELAENFPLRVIVTVKKISKEDHPTRFCRIDDIDKIFEIVVIGFYRNRNPRPAEMIDLSAGLRVVSGTLLSEETAQPVHPKSRIPLESGNVIYGK
jgi:hypothetical protein